MTEKTLLARVSLPSGHFLQTWKIAAFRGFTKQLNGGCSECVVELAVPFSYDGPDLREGNFVDLTVSDGDTLSATESDGFFGERLIYRGYVSLIERELSADTERVTVHLLGYYTLLAIDVLKSGSQTTLYSKPTVGLTTTQADLAAADIGLLVRTVVDQFNTQHPTTPLHYSSDDVPDIGTSATYTFTQRTYREAIDALKALAPGNIYWYVDEAGQFTFKERPAAPTHTFILGRHFSNVRVERSIEKVRNSVLIWNGDTTYKLYEDAGSIAMYGRRTERINDYGISGTNAADALGAKFLAENKDPGIKLVCTILDNNNVQGLGADIEEIQPGDTCRLVGFTSDLADTFPDNMLITRVGYNLDAVQIEIELTKSGFVDLQSRQSKEISAIGSGGLGIPASYS